MNIHDVMNEVDSGWSKSMSLAYDAGLKDARAGKTSREEEFDFRACYLEGYRHGLNVFLK